MLNKSFEMDHTSNNIQESIDAYTIEQVSLLQNIRQVKKALQEDASNNMLKFELSLLTKQYDSYNDLISNLQKELKN